MLRSLAFTAVYGLYCKLIGKYPSSLEYPIVFGDSTKTMEKSASSTLLTTS